MKTQTVDYGIDLGTTNSVIAKATGTGTKVIKNRLQDELTPSAVARTSAGQTLVGQDALDKPMLSPAQRFKRLMGTKHRLSLHDGSEMLPEELSAEVLKEMKAAVQLRYDETLQHVVVTVPAMFQQPQCEATHRAAELAGLEAVVLLQEPIAAATAYINDDPQEGSYLVYDLGGGTFDVSIVRLRDGEMSVVAHGGDNHLGGSDFDLRVYEWVLDRLERKYGQLPELREQPKKHMMLKVCEAAKIALSLSEETRMDFGDLDVPVSHIMMDRSILEDLIENYVTCTLSLTKERLEQADLDAADIVRLVMVGGSTMIPCIRRRLREELDAPLSFEQDPMTVVAVGAAIHAGTILKPNRAQTRQKATDGQLSVELYYDPVSPDVETTISGRIIEPEDFNGEVRIATASGDWDSGWIALADHAFACDIRLASGRSTEFLLSARDFQGNILAVNPGAIAIRHGIAAAKPVTPYQYSVAIQDGTCRPIIDRNQALPAAGRHEFQAAKTVPAGSSDELAVYFLEGMSTTASDNVKVGELRISGQDLQRTLREGEQVEVRVYMDESRLAKARVFIPLHDLDYEVKLQSMVETPQAADLLSSMQELRGILGEVDPLVTDEDADIVLQAHRDIEQIEAEAEGLESGQPGISERIAVRLAASKAKLRTVQSKYEVQAKYHDAVDGIEWAERMATDHGDNIGLATVADLRKDAERCLRLEDPKGLESVESRASEIFWQHYVKTEECWIGLVQYLREQRRFANNPIAYDEYLKRAEDCLSRRDFEGTRLNGRQAMSYLPAAESKINRFWDAGLR